jgi:hypothetical protein
MACWLDQYKERLAQSEFELRKQHRIELFHERRKRSVVEEELNRAASTLRDQDDLITKQGETIEEFQKVGKAIISGDPTSYDWRSFRK